MNHHYHPTPISDHTLSQEESSHAIKVLRKRVGDIIYIMDGKGSEYKAEITNDNFRKCEFKIIDTQRKGKKPFGIHIAIAPTKNIDRIEWFVEKAGELGVDKISLIRTTRTERTVIKTDRLEKKAISAMKQSKGFWKCEIEAFTTFDHFIKEPITGQKFIAFVETGHEEALFKLAQASMNTVIMIGPEGDFTLQEVSAARNQGFQTSNLGKSVLRTETAGVIAAHTINIINRY